MELSMSLNKHILAVIDIDGLYYHCSKDTIQESIEELDKRFSNILNKTKATHYVAFCSQGRYFRNKVKSSYKGQRKPTNLKWIGTLKAYSKVKYGVRNHDEVEADDLCAYVLMNPFYIINVKENDYTKYSYISQSFSSEHECFEFEKILCSPDKDLIQGFSGRHFNYTYKLKDKEDLNSLIEGWFVETSKDYSDKFFWMQMLMGDSADGITGIPGIGPKKADRIIQASTGKENYERIALEEYISHYGIGYGVKEFQETYNLLKLLTTDAEFINYSGIIPSFDISKVDTEEENKENENDDIPKFE